MEKENKDKEGTVKKNRKRGVDALASFKAIMAVVDRHRPYEPSDFVKESYIPDI